MWIGFIAIGSRSSCKCGQRSGQIVIQLPVWTGLKYSIKQFHDVKFRAFYLNHVLYIFCLYFNQLSKSILLRLLDTVLASRYNLKSILDSFVMLKLAIPSQLCCCTHFYLTSNLVNKFLGILLGKLQTNYCVITYPQRGVPIICPGQYFEYIGYTRTNLPILGQRDVRLLTDRQTKAKQSKATPIDFLSLFEQPSLHIYVVSRIKCLRWS